MLRIQNQTYLCTPSETVQIASLTTSGALQFFLDDVPQPNSSFNFNMPAGAGAARKLGAVLIGPAGSNAAVKIKVVSNRPAQTDVTILLIPAQANHASTVWDFSNAATAALMSFAEAVPSMPLAPKKVKPPKKGGN